MEKKRKMFQCDICNKAFHKPSKVTTHRKIDHGYNQQISCDICDQQCGSKYSFKKHIKTHDDETKKRCNLCHEHFKNLKYHILTIHGKAQSIVELEKFKPYVCELCNASFDFESKLEDHVTSLHEKKNQCGICSQNLMSKFQLKYHESLRHNGTLQFTCDICEKIFVQNTHSQVMQYLYMN